MSRGLEEGGFTRCLLTSVLGRAMLSTEFWKFL